MDVVLLLCSDIYVIDSRNKIVLTCRCFSVYYGTLEVKAIFAIGPIAIICQMSKKSQGKYFSFANSGMNWKFRNKNEGQTGNFAQAYFNLNFMSF